MKAKASLPAAKMVPTVPCHARMRVVTRGQANRQRYVVGGRISSGPLCHGLGFIRGGAHAQRSSAARW